MIRMAGRPGFSQSAPVIKELPALIQERWAVTFAALRLHKIVAVVGPNEYVRHAIEALLLPVHEPPRANLQRAILILTSQRR